MKILDRYIAKTLLFYTLGVLVVWIGIYAFFNFIDEIKFIGQGDYTITKAAIYVAADLPAVIYSHSSVIILLGCLLALGHLASTSQLVIVRGGGVSIMQIAKIVIRSAILFIAIIIFIGEIVSPITTEYAENSRAKALGSDISAINQQGFWIKDGNSIINVKKNFGGHLFGDITLIKLNELNQLDSVVHSKRAIFNGNNLDFENTVSYELNHDDKLVSIQLEEYQKYNTQVTFDQELIASLKKEPHELSTWNLYKQINFLTNNNLATKAFEVELYKRIIKPITLIAMLLFSMLFIFGSLRDSSLGKKIFLGVMVSLFFELASRLGGMLSLRFDYNPLLSASIPTAIVLVIAFILLRRKSAR